MVLKKSLNFTSPKQYKPCLSLYTFFNFFFFHNEVVLMVPANLSFEGSTVSNWFMFLVPPQIQTTLWIGWKKQWIHPLTARWLCLLQQPLREVAALHTQNTSPCQRSLDARLNTTLVLVMEQSIILAQPQLQGLAKGHILFPFSAL